MPGRSSQLLRQWVLLRSRAEAVGQQLGFANGWEVQESLSPRPGAQPVSWDSQGSKEGR